MRRTLILCALLFSCSSLWAGGTGDGWRISILASEISQGGNQPWSEDPHAGISVGFAYAPVPQWDIELTAGSQSHVSPYTRFVVIPIGGGLTGPAPFTEFHRYRVRPVDLTVTRHFLPGQAVMPYVRAGLRYVDAPNDPQAITTIGVVPVEGPAFPVTVAEGFGFRNRMSGEAGAGVRVRLTERTALRVEANRLLRSDGTDFDPLTRYAAGVSWKF